VFTYDQADVLGTSPVHSLFHVGEASLFGATNKNMFGILGQDEPTLLERTEEADCLHLDVTDDTWMAVYRQKTTQSTTYAVGKVDATWKTHKPIPLIGDTAQSLCKGGLLNTINGLSLVSALKPNLLGQSIIKSTPLHQVNWKPLLHVAERSIFRMASLQPHQFGLSAGRHVHIYALRDSNGLG
jgi:hypothetical protein